MIKLLVKVYQIIVCIFAVVIFYMNYGDYQFYLGSSIKPLYYVIGSLVLTFPFFSNKHTLHKVLHNPLIYWVFAYILLGLIFSLPLLPVNIYGEITAKSLDGIIRSGFLVFSIVILLSHKNSIKIIMWLILLANIIAVYINYIDFVGADPTDYCPIYGRAAGMYINPNLCSIVLIFGTIISVKVLPIKLRLPYLLLILVGIFFTVSRGGVVSFFLLLALYTIYRYINVKHLLLTVSMIIFSVVSGTLLKSISLLLSNFHVQGVVNAEVDITMFDRLGSLFSGGEAVTSNIKNDQRAELLSFYWKLYLDSPILGNGLGSNIYYATRNPVENGASHNQFIHNLNDFGVLGFVIYIFLIFCIGMNYKHFILKQNWIIFALLFSFFSFTSHNLLEAFPMLFLYPTYQKYVEISDFNTV